MSLDARSTARAWPGLLLLLLMVAAVYLPGWGGGFVFDDISNIVENKALKVDSLELAQWKAAAFSSPASELQRPLSMLTFAANHYFSGMDPGPMKLTNLALHLLNTLLVFLLVRTLLSALAPGAVGSDTRRTWVALFVASAWALNPINFMAVLYVVQRMESLCHTFVFAGLWLYLRARLAQLRGRSAEWQVPAILAGGTVLGLLAKESAVLLPLYAFLAEFVVLRFQGPGQFAPRRLKLVFLFLLWIPAVIAVAWLLPQSLRPAAYSSRDFTMYERILTEGRVLVDYAHWTLLPKLNAMGLYHDDYVISQGWWSPASTALAWLGLVAAAAVAWLARHRRPLSSLGIAWFLAAHALTASFIPLELVFEHRNYFASLGLMLVLADLLLVWPALPSRRFAGTALALALVALYALGTWTRSREWSNPLEFAQSEALKHPESRRAQYDLARMLIIQSGYEKSSPYWPRARKAIAAARRVPGAGVMPAQAELIFAARSGDAQDPQAWKDFTESLRTQPIGPEQLGALAAMTNCATKKLCDFTPEHMIGAFSAALEQGDNPEVLNIYGSYALVSLKDTEFCLRLWKEARRLRPKEAQYRINLIRLWIAQGKPELARPEIDALRGMGTAGQFSTVADKFEKELEALPAGEKPAKSG